MLIGTTFPQVARTQIPVLIGIRAAVPVCQAAVRVRVRSGVLVRRAATILIRQAATVLVRAQAKLILPMIGTEPPVRRGHPRLRATLPVLPAAVPLRWNWQRPILGRDFPLPPPLNTLSLGLVGISVSGRERVRPHGPELAQPLLGRGFAEIGLRPLISGPPAEFHLRRHPPKNPPHHQYNQRALARPTGTQAQPAGVGLPGPSFMSSGLRWSDRPRRSPGA